MSHDWPKDIPRPGDSIDLNYLRPLVAAQDKDALSEALVSLVSDNQLTVASLSAFIEDGAKNGFKLGVPDSFSGKHHSTNYKSANSTFREQTHNSLMKRLAKSKTSGPYQWSGNVQDLPFERCTINPMGAVPYKYEQDRARACDDAIINDYITAPYFRMPANQQIRDLAFLCCSWYKSDVADAFLSMAIATSDLPFMLFTWYHPDDTTFSGTDQDYLYVHTHGNFGPRPWPYSFTMLMLYVNLAAKTLGIDIPAAFIDDNVHTGRAKHLEQQAIPYHMHLQRAGLKDKAAKRELLIYMGEILGKYYNSISMTISIP